MEGQQTTGIETAPLIDQRPAGFGGRFVAQLIDALLLTAVFVVVRTILRLGDSAAGLAIPWILTAAYYSLGEGLAEQTLGKRLLHIKVIDDFTGERIGPPRAMLRFAFSWVSFIVVLAGYLWMLGNDAGQTWHDQVAHSLVILA